jgi:hypothetical protein
MGYTGEAKWCPEASRRGDAKKPRRRAGRSRAGRLFSSSAAAPSLLLPLCLLICGASSTILLPSLVMLSYELSSYSVAAGSSWAGGLRDNDEGDGGAELRLLWDCLQPFVLVMWSREEVKRSLFAGLCPLVGA